jgi:IMP dehydrogenase
MDTRTDVLNADQISIGLGTALTFDDVPLVPQHWNVLSRAVNVATQHPQHHTSCAARAARWTLVTESRLAIAMAQQGGIGIIHRTHRRGQAPESIA